jgi:hypothetical protein
MLGITDPMVLLAYLLVPGCTALCVVYGIVNWNKEGEVSEEELNEERKWLKEEIEIDKQISGEDLP